MAGATMIRAIFALIALLSFGAALAESTGDMLRNEFHSQADQFNFDPQTRRFSYTRQACTDSALMHIADSRGWQSLADQNGIDTYQDVIALRPKIRIFFRGICS